MLNYQKARQTAVINYAPYELATSPRFITDHAALAHVTSLPDVEDVIDFAADIHKVDPTELSSLAIIFSEGNKGASGNTSTVPQRLGPDGAVHFPVIRLNPGLKPHRMNRVLRHEIRHVFQEAKTPLYDRREYQLGVKVISAAMAAGVMAKGYELYAEHDMLRTTAAAATSLVASGFVHPTLAEGLLWVASGSEWDAEIFSARTRSFKPIK